MVARRQGPLPRHTARQRRTLRHRQAPGTPWQRWLGAAGLSTAAPIACVAVLPGAIAQLTLRLAIIVVLMIGTVAALGTARRADPGDRSWRYLLAAALAMLEITGLWYLIATVPLVGPAESRLSYVQLTIVIPLVLVLLALLRYPASPGGPGPTGRGPLGPRWWIATLLDGLIVVCSVGMLAWTLFLRRVVAAGVDDVETLVVILVFCALGLLMICTAVALWAFRRPARPGGFILLAVGIVLMCVSFLADAQNATVGTAIVRNGPLACWLIAVWLLPLACLAPAPSTRPHGQRLPSRRARARTRWAHAVLPLLPLAVAGLTVLLDVTVGSGPRLVDIAVLLALPLLGLARQMVILADNIGLLHRLEISEQRLQYQAYHDPLTGLANRALFGDRLRRALAAQRHDRYRFAVLYVDLDDFKRVNDTLGHAAGDRLLQVTARRLTRAVRSGDTVARLGGDEFAILIVPGGDAPATVGSRVLTAVRAPALLAGPRHTVRASVGLVVADADEELSAERVLHRADAAMYAAKSTGKGSLTVYTPVLGRDATGAAAPTPRAALVRALRGQDSDGDLRVRYSPIVDLPDVHPAGLRVELRWSHPVYGEVPAADLVPTSERLGMLPALTHATLDRVLADLPRLRAGPTPPPVHLVIHAAVPPTPALVSAVRGALADGRLRPGELVVDLVGAERGLDPAGWEARMGQIGAHGVGLCLADFGAADTNLMLLCCLPVDTVALTSQVTAIWTLPTVDGPTQDRNDVLRDRMLALLADFGVRLMVTDLPNVEATARAVDLGATLAIGQVPLPPRTIVAAEPVPPTPVPPTPVPPVGAASEGLRADRPPQPARRRYRPRRRRPGRSRR
ncbi:diguanylate cyclase [Frankia sp. AgB32]|uniref:diguanylate cyclase domain-containing protein n=1 Tax=Frankia sp. AgB32 TaxID=631119 RepID=UPI00200D1823|nr:diguanylate cyclase [Frankia sp. AgB32]MCK9896000.1 diguanylate cyclase [Frankia sp. AgB32]